jgi:hypothetical protein
MPHWGEQSTPAWSNPQLTFSRLRDWEAVREEAVYQQTRTSPFSKPLWQMVTMNPAVTKKKNGAVIKKER